MHHFTFWTLFISRINRAWLYKGLNDSHRQLNSELAQLGEHGTDDPEVVSSNSTGGNFWMKFILCCVTSDLSDNLTEMRQTGLS